MTSLLLLGVLCVCAFAAAGAQAKDLSRYIVVLEDSVERPGERARIQTEQQDGRLGFVYRHALNGYSAELPKAAVEALRRNPSVASVEPDVRGGVASQTVPTGIDRIFATASPMLDIDEEDDVRVNADVAVLDTGIDAEHPDLNVVSQVNCNGSFPASCKAGGNDGNGHGTHVAGTIGAIDNDYGVVGVAPGARLWSVKVLDNGGFGNLSEFIAGIDWITANASQIEVANSSLRYWFETSSEAFDKAIKGSLDAGVVHVVAAGNEGETVKYIPGNHPDVITVSALEDHDGLPGGEEEGKDPLAWFSNFGSVIDVAAPGVDILSTFPGNNYASLSGTSMASPHVAGAAAILASQANPGSREDVEGIRYQIVEGGNLDWVDVSGDGVQEPLLEISNAPAAVTLSAGDVKATSAKLNASINPMGLETTYQFEYGETTSYGSEVPVSPEEAGSGTEFAGASEVVEGLMPNTTYHFRIVASNEDGPSYGEDKTFTTLAQRKWERIPMSSVGSRLTDVSCMLEAEVGVDFCANVGSDITPAGTEWAISMQGSGGSSSLMEPPRPGGAKASKLTSIACPGPSKCVAFGSYLNVKSEWKSFDAIFDRETEEWSLGEMSAMGWSGNSIEDAACVGPEECVAVGYITSGANDSPVVFRQEGEGWKLSVPPTPEGAKSSRLAAVFCTTLEDCHVMGSYSDSEGAVANFGLAGAPSAFELTPVPTPPEAQVSSLSGVECLEPESCLAVGNYEDEEGVSTPQAVAWDGTEWSVSSPATPEGAIASELNDVTCVASVECIAAGTLTEESAELPLGLGWNGSEWSDKEVAASAIEYGPELGDLTAISCSSTASCHIVGTGISSVLNPEGVDYRLEAPQWWGEGIGTLNSGSISTVACADATKEVKFACVGTGSVSGPEGTGFRGWESKGEGWSKETMPKFEPFEWQTESWGDVACSAVDSCMAVGRGYGRKPLVARWKPSGWGGGKWALSMGALPTSQVAWLEGVSCTATNHCVAVGVTASTKSSTVDLPLAEVWNGSSWSIQTPPAPSKALDTRLESVSCASASFCASVGRYYLEEGTPIALVERWNGTSWAIDEIPLPEGATKSELTSVSCTSSSACTAVGAYAMAGWTLDMPLYLRWNGSSWSLQTPPAETTGVPSDVDCYDASGCVVAANFYDGNTGRNSGVLLGWDGSEWLKEAVDMQVSERANFRLESVACSSAGDCAAVGYGAGSEVVVESK